MTVAQIIGCLVILAALCWYVIYPAAVAVLAPPAPLSPPDTRAALLAIANPTPEAREQMRRFGLEAFDRDFRDWDFDREVA